MRTNLLCVFTVLLLGVCGQGWGQGYGEDVDDGKTEKPKESNIKVPITNLSFNRVINTDSVGKINIYNSIKEWVGLNFKSAKNVIQIDDKDAGMLILKGNMTYSFGGLTYMCYDGYVDYTINIKIKDNRYKVEISDFIHTVKIGNSKSCELGLVTTKELYQESGFQKGYNNKVWKHLKYKSEFFSNQIFDELNKQTINVKNTNKDTDW